MRENISEFQITDEVVNVDWVNKIIVSGFNIEWFDDRQSTGEYEQG